MKKNKLFNLNSYTSNFFKIYFKQKKIIPKQIYSIIIPPQIPEICRPAKMAEKADSLRKRHRQNRHSRENP